MPEPLTDDLFKLPDPSRGHLDARRPVNVGEAEEDVGLCMIADMRELEEILIREVRAAMPPAAEIERFKAEGHRYRIEDGCHVTGGLLTKVTPEQWAWMVREGLRGDKVGTFHTTIRQTQNNGSWVPTAVAVRHGVEPRNDRTRPARKGSLPAGTDSIGEHSITVPVPVDVLQYRIVWTDAANQDDMKYDAKGQLLAQFDVKVGAQQTDPALLAALAEQATATRALAESMAPTPPAPAPTQAPAKKA